MFRRAADGEVEVLLVHPGGPFWARKDAGAWTIPKGEYDDSEEALAAAKREFVEETGLAAIEPFIPLGSLKQPSGKWISIWAFESDCDPADWSATPSKWNGRPDLAANHRSLKSTGQAGFASMRQRSSYQKARSRSSCGSPTHCARDWFLPRTQYEAPSITLPRPQIPHNAPRCA